MFFSRSSARRRASSSSSSSSSSSAGQRPSQHARSTLVRVRASSYHPAPRQSCQQRWRPQRERRHPSRVRPERARQLAHAMTVSSRYLLRIQPNHVTLIRELVDFVSEVVCFASRGAAASTALAASASSAAVACTATSAARFARHCSGPTETAIETRSATRLPAKTRRLGRIEPGAVQDKYSCFQKLAFQFRW